MKRILFLGTLLVSSLVFSQSKINFGAPFDMDLKLETDMHFAMMDDSNFFLSSASNSESNFYQKFFVRKFDQSNKMVSSFSEPFKAIDDRAIGNYVGSFSNANAIVFFNESSSGKNKKVDLYKTVFDKKSETFSSSLVASYPIESLMKSGNSYFAISDNGRYAVTVYQSYQGRKDPKLISAYVFETGATKEAYHKDLTVTDEFSARYIAVSNSGKVIVTRDPVSYKEGSKIHIISKDGEDEKMMDPNVLLYQPYIFSKGSQELLFAFNSSTRATKDSPDSFLIYDLESGNVISNTKSVVYSSLKLPEKAFVRKVFFNNEEFQVFAEAKKQIGTKPSSLNSAFTDPVYAYQKGSLMSFDQNGVSKNSVGIGSSYSSNSSGTDIFRAFGVENVMGNFYITHGDVKTIEEINPRDISVVENLYIFRDKAEFSGDEKSGSQLNDVLAYYNKTKTFYFVQSNSQNSSQIVTASGFEKEEKKKK